MVILISTLFMFFFISGFMIALYLMKFAKKYYDNQPSEKTTEIKGTPTNNTQDLMSEWLYGELKNNGGGDINE